MGRKSMGERDSRTVSQPSLVESGPDTRPIARGKCRAAILYDVRKTYASARQRYESDGTGREEREIEREGQHEARCIGRRTNLCRCHANVRIRSLSTCVHAGFDLSSKRVRERIPLSIERFLSNFYTQLETPVSEYLNIRTFYYPYVSYVYILKLRRKYNVFRCDINTFLRSVG